jgi:hypothetical protein
MNIGLGSGVMAMFAIEMKFIFSGKLELTAGSEEIGPVEIELFFSIWLLIMGFTGVGGMT